MNALESSSADTAAPLVEPSSSESPLDPTRHLSLRQVLVASWGVAGVLFLLAQAIYRLGGRAVEAHAMALSWQQLAISACWIALNAYAEGYRAFQRRFSPRVVARALHLARHPTPLGVLLAPAYCMAFFHASRRGKIIAWATTAMVISFIVLLRQVPEPWRGIVDGGVAVALLWGALVILALFLRALISRRVPEVSLELPDAPHEPGAVR